MGERLPDPMRGNSVKEDIKIFNTSRLIESFELINTFTANYEITRIFRFFLRRQIRVMSS